MIYKYRCAYLFYSSACRMLKWKASIIAKMSHSLPTTPLEPLKNLCTANIIPVVVLQHHIQTGIIKIEKGAPMDLLKLKYTILYQEDKFCFKSIKHFLKKLNFFRFIINLSCLLQYNFCHSHFTIMNGEIQKHDVQIILCHILKIAHKVTHIIFVFKYK